MERAGRGGSRAQPQDTQSPRGTKARESHCDQRHLRTLQPAFQSPQGSVHLLSKGQTANAPSGLCTATAASHGPSAPPLQLEAATVDMSAKACKQSVLRGRRNLKVLPLSQVTKHSSRDPHSTELSPQLPPNRPRAVWPTAGGWGFASPCMGRTVRVTFTVSELQSDNAGNHVRRRGDTEGLQVLSTPLPCKPKTA